MPTQGMEPSGRIVVVDDDASMRELIGLHLFNADYSVALAEDAIQAGYMVLASPPGLLIVNAELPYFSGLDFVATLLADSTLPSVPVIFISEHETHADQAELLGADYLRKPIFKEVLLAAVERKFFRVTAKDQPGVADVSYAEIRGRPRGRDGAPIKDPHLYPVPGEKELAGQSSSG
jgi:DNA-binding response OmpR family regulator